MIYIYIMYDIIHDITISTLTFPALQPPILPRHSLLIQPTTIVNPTDQWISTRSVTFADQDPLTDMDMEDDAEIMILSLLLKRMPSCIDGADIEQLRKYI